MVWMNHFVKMTMGISLLYSLLQVITATIVIKGFAPHVRQLVTYTLGVGRNEKEYKHNLITVKKSCRKLSGISVTSQKINTPTCSNIIYTTRSENFPHGQ